MARSSADKNITIIAGLMLTGTGLKLMNAPTKFAYGFPTFLGGLLLVYDGVIRK